MTPNYLHRAQRLLAASMRCDDLEIATVYLAHARLAMGVAKEELKELALLLRAREDEMVRRGSPKEQALLGEAKS